MSTTIQEMQFNPQNLPISIKDDFKTNRFKRIQVKHIGSIDFRAQIQNQKLSKNKQGVLNLELLHFEHPLDKKTSAMLIKLSVSPALNVSFQNIIKLSLQNQFFENIEFLQLFNFKNLQMLHLNNNVILHVGSLKKCRFPQLGKVNLNNNRIQDLSSLSRADFNELNEISFDFNPKAQLGLYKNYLKLGSKTMKNVYINYLETIKSRQKCLQEEYIQFQMTVLCK